METRKEYQAEVKKEVKKEPAKVVTVEQADSENPGKVITTKWKE